MDSWKWSSQKTIGLILLIIISASITYHGTIPSVLTWDVYGYYLYLPAIFKYGDMFEYAFALQHVQDYQVSSSLYQLKEFSSGRAPIYTMGMAMLYLPFYLFADLIAHLHPGFVSDGLSPPYQWSIVVASWIYALVGLIFAQRLLKILKIKDHLISVVLFAVFLGTNYFHYVAFENGMPHSYLMSLYIVLAYFTIQWHLKPTVYKSIVLGSLIGLMFLIRPSEIIVIIIPLGYGVYNGLSFLVKNYKFIQHSRKIFTAILSGTLLVFCQLLYWKLNIGVWVFNGYEGHHFDFFSPHIIDGLFSYRKGWFIYTPLAMLALVGIPYIWFRDKRWFWPILIFTALNVYWVLSWHIWWYASSFGMRALIQSFGILIIPFAFLMEWVWSKSKLISVGFTGIVLVFILLNQFQDWQYRNQILLKDEMTKTYYWKVFGQTTYNPSDRRYVDLDELFEGMHTDLRNLYNSPEGNIDTIPPGRYSPAFRTELNQENIIPNNWLKVKATVKASLDNFGKWDQARLVQNTIQKGKNIKWRGMRFQYLIQLEDFKDIEMEYRIPSIEGRDGIYETYIWNAGPDTIYLSNFRVDIIEN